MHSLWFVFSLQCKVQEQKQSVRAQTTTREQNTWSWRSLILM